MAISMGTQTPELNINQQLNNSDGANAPSAELNQSESTGKDTENRNEIDNKPATTAVVTYVGNGIWTDNKGKKWKHDDENQVSMQEYNTRKDLKFMVNYGEMKVTFV